MITDVVTMLPTPEVPYPLHCHTGGRFAHALIRFITATIAGPRHTEINDQRMQCIKSEGFMRRKFYIRELLIKAAAAATAEVIIPVPATAPCPPKIRLTLFGADSSPSQSFSGERFS